MKFRYVVAAFIIIGIGVGAFFWGRASESHANASSSDTSTTSGSLSTAKGPIGAASGDVEYVCTNSTGGTAATYSAAIAAVTGGSDKWTCPTSEFSDLGEVQVGGSFFCSARVYDPDAADGTGEDWTYGPYAAKIGSFSMSGVAGTYYGAYCVAPQSSAYESEASASDSSTTYSMTTS